MMMSVVFRPYKFIAAGCGLALALQITACAPVQTRTQGAPIVDRGEVIAAPEQGALQDEESGVIVQPYPPAGVDAQRLPDAEGNVARQAPRAAAPSGTAVIALLDNAGQQSRAGKLDGAAAALERALRIEPRNPEIWHRLATVRLQQGQFDQAAGLAAKSINLAGNNTDLIARNRALIAQARQRQTSAP